MKLIDILVRELPKLGGWPFNITAAVQDGSGYVYQAGGGNHMFHSELADDWMMAEIPREQYEAALAASKPEWDGKGLPPVGCECEFKANDGGWGIGTVLCVGKNRIFWLCHEDGDEYTSEVNPQEFRPIRSEADQNRDLIISKIEKAYKDCPHSDAVPQAIYEAIAEHIRID